MCGFESHPRHQGLQSLLTNYILYVESRLYAFCEITLMLRNSVIIVGAGVGGMTAALCLARLGLDVHVFEQSDETQSLGGGIQLTPNCTRVLRQLEIDEELSSKATIPAVSYTHLTLPTSDLV